MIDLLRRVFIKDYKNIDDEKVRQKHGILAAIIGIVTNLSIVILKVTIAFVLAFSIHHQNSSISILDALPMALIADAINNLSDMINSIVTLIGFKLAGKPADKDHPFGHERIEYIAGLIVSIVVIVLAVILFKESLTKVINKTEIQYELLTIIILGITILIKVLQGYSYYKISKIISSNALKSSSVDSLLDCVSTGLILVSAVLSYLLKWNFLDGYLGLAVSILIFISGIKMIKEAASPLIGEKNNETVKKDVLDIVLSHKEVYGVHDILCHSYGPTKYFISLHCEMNQDLSVLEAHRIIDEIESEINKKYNFSVTIHIDPVAIFDPHYSSLKKDVANVLKQIDSKLDLHDFQVSEENGLTQITFDILSPYEETLSESDILDELNLKMESSKNHYSFIVHFDHPF